MILKLSLASALALLVFAYSEPETKPTGQLTSAESKPTVKNLEVKDMCIKSACASLPLASSQAKGMMKFSLSELPSCKVKPKLNPLEDLLSDPSLNDSLRWTRLQALSQSWAHEARLIKTQQDLYHSQLCALEVIRVHLEQVALSDYKLFLGSQKKKPSP